MRATQDRSERLNGVPGVAKAGHVSSSTQGCCQVRTRSQITEQECGGCVKGSTFVWVQSRCAERGSAESSSALQETSRRRVLQRRRCISGSLWQCKRRQHEPVVYLAQSHPENEPLCPERPERTVKEEWGKGMKPAMHPQGNRARKVRGRCGAAGSWWWGTAWELPSPPWLLCGC
jgi:hypothetical protein